MKSGVDTPPILCYYIGTQTNADLAHLVERDLAKVEVAGPSPVIRSIEKARARTGFFYGAACEFLIGAARRYGSENNISILACIFIHFGSLWRIFSKKTKMY